MGLPEKYPMEDANLNNAAYPATTKQSTAKINGVDTNVMSISFSDKIMITITQDGKLAQWISVPLLSDSPTQLDPHLNVQSSEEDSLLPINRFQPRTLLGAGSSEREMMGQLYASQIASMITRQSPEECRTLLLGLGLAKVEVDRDIFLETVNLVLNVL